jgi:hypothetical protein
VTTRLLEAFFAILQGRAADERRWLTYIEI